MRNEREMGNEEVEWLWMIKRIVVTEMKVVQHSDFVLIGLRDGDEGRVRRGHDKVPLAVAITYSAVVVLGQKGKRCNKLA